MPSRMGCSGASGARPAGCARKPPAILGRSHWDSDLAHNESRSWHSWHRHVSLVMPAFAMLTRVRRLANGAPPKTVLIATLAGALVDPGDPARGVAAGTAAHLARCRHRLVRLKTRSSSGSPISTSETAHATVMQNMNRGRCNRGRSYAWYSTFSALFLISYHLQIPTIRRALVWNCNFKIKIASEKRQCNLPYIVIK